jgi:hypothetical protein
MLVRHGRYIGKLGRQNKGKLSAAEEWQTAILPASNADVAMIAATTALLWSDDIKRLFLPTETKT